MAAPRNQRVLIGYLHARDSEIRTLRRQLRDARSTRAAGEEFRRLYYEIHELAGQQASEIESLRAYVQHGRDENERQFKAFDSKQRENHERVEIMQNQKNVADGMLRSAQGQLVSARKATSEVEEKLKAVVADKKDLMTELKTLKEELKASAMATSSLAEQLAAARLQVETLERAAGSSSNTIDEPGAHKELTALAFASQAKTTELQDGMEKGDS